MKPFGFPFLLSVLGNWSVTVTRVKTDAPKGQQDTSHVGNENQIFLWWVWLKSFQEGKTEEKLWRGRGRLLRRKQVFKIHREVSAQQVMEDSLQEPSKAWLQNLPSEGKTPLPDSVPFPKVGYVQEIKGDKSSDIVVPPFHHLQYPLLDVNPESIFCSVLFCH